MVTHSSILGWRIHTDRGAWQAAICGVAKIWTRLIKHTTISFVLTKRKMTMSRSDLIR